MKSKYNNKKLKSCITNHLILIFIGCTYFLIIKFLNYSIPCRLHETTGFSCALCGITRMLVSFANLNFIEGLSYNIGFGITLPFLLFFYIFYLNDYIKEITKRNAFYANITKIYIIYLCLWMLIRNIFHI